MKRVLDTLNTAPGAVSAAICSNIWAVKEPFLSLSRRLSDIFDSATENMAYTFRIAA